MGIRRRNMATATADRRTMMASQQLPLLTAGPPQDAALPRVVSDSCAGTLFLDIYFFRFRFLNLFFSTAFTPNLFRAAATDAATAPRVYWSGVNTPRTDVHV